MAGMRMARFILMGGLLSLVAGCVRPPNGASLGQAQGVQGQAAIHGTVSLEAFHAQSTMADIYQHATVTLIDTATNQAMASTVTDASGNFSLTLGQTVLSPSSTYYLEAFKGLAGNLSGRSAARVRTILAFQNGAWRSLSSNPGDVRIDRSTTALAIVASLRGTTTNPVNASTLLGTLVPGVPDTTMAPTTDDQFTGASNALTGVSEGEFHQVWQDVTDALARNADPMAWVLVNINRNASPPWYSYTEAGNAFQIASLSPASAPIGGTVTFQGNNFDPNLADDTVKFNGVPATVQSVTPDGTQLVATVPVGATSGPVSLQEGNIVGLGPSFTVTSDDGHRVFDAAGNLYVCGQQNGTVFRIAPDGTATLFASGFNQPVALALDSNLFAGGAGYMYVADAGTNALYRLTSSGASASFATGLNKPAALAIDPSGDVYVSNTGGNTVTEYSSSGAVAATVSGLSSPTGIALDPSSGALYIANTGANTLLKDTGGTLTTLASGLASPLGLAVDTASNVYVVSGGVGSIYRILPAGSVTVYATGYNGSFNNGRSLAFDRSGNLYLATTDNRVFQLNHQTSSQTLYASAASGTQGLAFDPSGNLYIASSNGNDIVKVAAGATTAEPFASIQSPGLTVVDGNGNLFVASTTNNGNTGTIYKVTPGGAVSNFMQPGSQLNGLGVDGSGDIYYNYGPGWVNTSNQLFELSPSGASLGQYSYTPFDGAWIASAGSGIFYLTDRSQLAKWDGTQLTAVASTPAYVLSGVAVDGAGKIYTCAQDQGTIYKYDPVANTTVAWATGLPTAGWGNGGPGPVDLAFSGSYAYVVDTQSNTIVQLNASTGAIVTPHFITGLSNPHGIVADAWGNLYISDDPSSGGNTTGKIYKMSASTGGAVSTAALYVNAAFDMVNELALDGSGNLYIQDTNAGTYEIATSSLAVSLIYGDNGNPGIAYDGTGALLTSSGNELASFPLPGGPGSLPARAWGGWVGPMAFDVAGNLWLGSNNGLFEVSSGGRVQKWISNSQGSVTGLAFDGTGNLYTTSSDYSGPLQELPAGGSSLVTVANGLNYATRIAIDPTGTYALVAENGNNPSNGPDIRKVTLATGAISNTYFWPYVTSF